ncbi:hypothetical protein SK128_020868 [Halocaridina rubra]|uniref:Neurotransmitter-gated ion-channel transmembrane domain-containing protein n=1 Tax=Halocaridina rubra TaxID=373956 RepID=A0AAN8WW37_HALRR
MTVFLPTAMLQIVGYTTLFVNVVLMDVRMAVSLTTLLVLYTLFSSTSDALPVTAYVKMIDVWFFFCIFLLFFIIVVHVAVEHMVNLAEEQHFKQVLPYDNRRTVEKSIRPTSDSAERLMFYSRYVVTPGVIILFNLICWGLVFGTSFKE